MLPIYGSGALVVLVSTIGARENMALTFLLGMTAATILEYVTGAVMERLFHVRYWDYSGQPFNLHGYISLASSLCWGCFSVLLVRVIHVPIESVVLRIPLAAAEGAALVLSVAAAADFTQSFNEAMDMKRILMAAGGEQGTDPEAPGAAQGRCRGCEGRLQEICRRAQPEEAFTKGGLSGARRYKASGAAPAA